MPCFVEKGARRAFRSADRALRSSALRRSLIRITKPLSPPTTARASSNVKPFLRRLQRDRLMSAVPPVSPFCRTVHDRAQPLLDILILGNIECLEFTNPTPLVDDCFNLGVTLEQNPGSSFSLMSSSPFLLLTRAQNKTRSSLHPRPLRRPHSEPVRAGG